MSAIAPPQVEYGADEISALVLDPGYSVVRAGFAGEDAPKSIVPTHYGRKPHGHSPLFGENAVHNPYSGLDIHNPMNEDGIVEDWDTASKLWEYTITSRLTGPKQTSPLRNGLNDEPKDGANGDTQMEDVEQNEKPMAESPLIVTEPGWNPTKNREKMMEIAMEEWDVPAFFLARSGVMAAFASGKPSALVIDIGASNTAVTPVYDGLMLKKGMLHSPIAGNFVSDQIRLLFSQTTPPTPLTPHYLVASKTPVDAAQAAQAAYHAFPDPQPTASFRRLQEERVLSEFKESVVHVWEPARMNGQSLSQAPDHVRQSEPGRPFEMPDGWNNVFGLEQYRPAEGLFDEKAALAGDPGTGRTMPTPTDKTTMLGLCKAALAAVDTDSKGHLLNNVVVVGGSSLLSGLTARLNHELSNQWPSMKVRLQSPGNIVERKYASWIGGSILASLGTFHQMWISKKEYEESGSGIVEKRCK